MQSFRTYFIVFEHTTDNLLYLDEMYLYGEIKEHMADVIYYQLPTETRFFVDGTPRALVVTPTDPADALVEYATDAEGPWTTTPIARTAAGVYTIHYRLSAPERTTATGSMTLTLTDDIVAAVRMAEAKDSKAYATAFWTTNALGGGEFFGSAANLFADKTDVRSLLRADPIVYYAISNTFRANCRFVVTGVCFRVNSALEFFSLGRLPGGFRVSGRNADGESWQPVGEVTSITWDESTHYDDATKIWTQEFPMSNRRQGYRQYRFDNWTTYDTQLESIALRGHIDPLGMVILVR